jgi:hypothetical protein
MKILLAEKDRTHFKRFPPDIAAGDMVRMPLEVILVNMLKPAEDIFRIRAYLFYLLYVQIPYIPFIYAKWLRSCPVSTPDRS